MQRDNPSDVADVTACFLDYERALAQRDLVVLAQYFDDSPSLVRFGVADQQRGPEELAAWRESQPPLPPGRQLQGTVVSTFGHEFAVVSTQFSYPGRAFTGRQSQTWARVDGRWRIVHAHVSEVPATGLPDQGPAGAPGP